MTSFEHKISGFCSMKNNNGRLMIGGGDTIGQIAKRAG